MRKIINLLKTCGLFLLILPIISCEYKTPATPNGNSLASTSSYTANNNTITIDNAGIVPVLNDTTTSIIYVHNNSNTTISGISYAATQNQTNIEDISTLQKINFPQLLDTKSMAQCARIEPMQACALRFTTPPLNKGQTDGSILISLNYTLHHTIHSFSQIINFQKIAYPKNGVNFNSGVSISGYGHKIGYATLYAYAGGNNQTYHINSITSNKIPLTINNKIEQDLSSNQVRAIEISSKIARRNFVATLTTDCTAKNTSGQNNYISSANVEVQSIVTGGVLIAGQIAVIDTAESINPAGSLLITNVGNESVTLESTAATSGISNLSGCTNGTQLLVGQSCTISFNVTQYDGNGSITLNYINYNNVPGSVTQTANWYNSLNGALASMTYDSQLSFIQSTPESIAVIVINQGGYNLTNVTIPNPQILTSTSTTAVISYPTTNSCENATLNVGESCVYILTVTDTATESNQQLLIGMSGTYNNGSAQLYTRYGAVTYSAAPYTYLYVSNSNASTVSGFLLDPSNGDLNQLSTSPYSTGEGPGLSVIAPNNQFMYTTQYDPFAIPDSPGNIIEFSINAANGQLTQIGSITTGIEPLDIVMTPNGKYLYITNWVSVNLTAYSVNSSTGALSKISNYSTGGN
ncbi:MAG: beta-propeller fold lactonase family protein, partial [Burkholderiales bacterium]|nr:beta-propeller fold lactonase family protein [Burkholderiales bacterium]